MTFPIRFKHSIDLQAAWRLWTTYWNYPLWIIQCGLAWSIKKRTLRHHTTILMPLPTSVYFTTLPVFEVNDLSSIVTSCHLGSKVSSFSRRNFFLSDHWSKQSAEQNQRIRNQATNWRATSRCCSVTVELQWTWWRWRNRSDREEEWNWLRPTSLPSPCDVHPRSSTKRLTIPDSRTIVLEYSTQTSPRFWGARETGLKPNFESDLSLAVFKQEWLRIIPLSWSKGKILA